MQHPEDLQLDPDPIRQFTIWLNEATRDSGLPNPNAMTLATATPGGMPSARIVLLKAHGPEGFVFYTNYESAKGRELAANPRAALVFHWDSLGRQVRIAGPVRRTSREESAEYFHSRPRESQLAAWASHQSETIESRGAMTEAWQEASDRYEGGEVPLPPYWGGFVVIPERIEFWISDRFRMHDRFVYRRAGADAWTRERLSP